MNDEKIEAVIDLTLTCLNEIVKKSERFHPERAEMKKDFEQNMIDGLKLLDKAHEDADDMKVWDAKDCVDKALILFSDAFYIFKKLEG